MAAAQSERCIEVFLDPDTFRDIIVCNILVSDQLHAWLMNERTDRGLAHHNGRLHRKLYIPSEALNTLISLGAVPVSQ